MRTTVCPTRKPFRLLHKVTFAVGEAEMQTWRKFRSYRLPPRYSTTGIYFVLFRLHFRNCGAWIQSSIRDLGDRRFLGRLLGRFLGMERIRETSNRFFERVEGKKSKDRRKIIIRYSSMDKFNPSSSLQINTWERVKPLAKINTWETNINFIIS